MGFVGPGRWTKSVFLATFGGTALMVSVGVLKKVTRGVCTMCLSCLMGCGDCVRCIVLWSCVAF